MLTSILGARLSWYQADGWVFDPVIVGPDIIEYTLAKGPHAGRHAIQHFYYERVAPGVETTVWYEESGALRYGVCVDGRQIEAVRGAVELLKRGLHETRAAVCAAGEDIDARPFRAGVRVDLRNTYKCVGCHYFLLVPEGLVCG